MTIAAVPLKLAPEPAAKRRPRKKVGDLFCGAGGTSLAARNALDELGMDMDLVVVNHWDTAIASHQLNHPTARHYCQDVNTVRPHLAVPERYLDLLTASPTCTYHSRARGGKPTSDQQRMLAARLALALQADGWWVRDEIVWHKLNPMPSSVDDRTTPAHEMLYLLTKSARYFYDAAAIMEESLTGDPRRPYGSQGAWQLDGRPLDQRPNGKRRKVKVPGGWDTGEGGHGTINRAGRTEAEYVDAEEIGQRNKRSVWPLATEPFPDAHFATAPTGLVEPCVLAGTSEKGCCAKCGAPWRRVAIRTFTPQQDVSLERGIKWADGQKPMDDTSGWDGFPRGTTAAVTTGWSPSCECGGDLAPCTVLDPFFGAGTTGLVADRHGRDCIGIELNPQYAAMAERRISGDAGMFAEVATDGAPASAGAAS